MHFSVLNKEEPLPSGHGHEGGILPFSVQLGSRNKERKTKSDKASPSAKAVPTHA